MCVSLAKVLISLGCSWVKLQSWNTEFCKAPNSISYSLSGAGVLLNNMIISMYFLL